MARASYRSFTAVPYSASFTFSSSVVIILNILSKIRSIALISHGSIALCILANPKAGRQGFSLLRESWHRAAMAERATKRYSLYTDTSLVYRESVIK